MAKKYFAVNCHYDMVITVDVVAENEQEAIEKAKSNADFADINKWAECYGSSECIAEEQELTDELQQQVDEQQAMFDEKTEEPTTINHRGNDVPALTWRGWDVRKLYNEYLTLLYKHEGDTDVTGESRESFLAAQAGDNYDAYFAMAYNAWDDLCSRYDGLRESGLDWYCGASTVGFPNEFDIYIGTGNENDPA